MKDMQPIGIVTIEYDENGRIEKARFDPSMTVEADDRLLKQLEVLEDEEEEIELQSRADLIMASWFTKINEIELADLNEWVIVSEVALCEKYVFSGKIRKCVLNYYFKKR